MNAFGILRRSNTLLVVIDVQEKFRPAVFQFDRVINSIRKLSEGFRLLGIPVVVTEQYPKGLGATVSEVKKSLGKFSPVEKISFSCFEDEKFRTAVRAHKPGNLVLAGIESHVCVLQTALDALAQGLSVHVAVDGISSIHESDHLIAVERLKQAGVFMASSEMLLFQLLDDAKDPDFKKLSGIVKKYA
jgi:nicotinamidase-related amidase